MKIDILELLHRAYVAGFSRSAEGYNGECPFDGDNNAIAREVRGSADISIEAILGSIPIDPTPRMTAVFACDIRKFKGNPFHQDTPFGRPIATCIGDALDDVCQQVLTDAAGPPPTLSAAMELPEVRALVEAARKSLALRDPLWELDVVAALAPFTEAKP